VLSGVFGDLGCEMVQRGGRKWRRETIPLDQLVDTYREVIEGTERVLEVFRDDDKRKPKRPTSWCFTGVHGYTQSRVRVPFRVLAGLDPSVLEVADLLPGTLAHRDTPDDPWVRVGHVYEDPLWPRWIDKMRGATKVFVILRHERGIVTVPRILRSRKAAEAMVKRINKHMDRSIPVQYEWVAADLVAE